MIQMGVLVPTGDMTAVRRTAQFFLNRLVWTHLVGVILFIETPPVLSKVIFLQVNIIIIIIWEGIRVLVGKLSIEVLIRMKIPHNRLISNKNISSWKWQVLQIQYTALNSRLWLFLGLFHLYLSSQKAEINFFTRVCADSLDLSVLFIFYYFIFCVRNICLYENFYCTFLIRDPIIFLSGGKKIFNDIFTEEKCYKLLQNI